MPRIKKASLFIALYGGLVLFLLTTNPASLPLPLLVLPFLWLYLCLLVGFYFLLYGVRRLLRGTKGRSNRLIVLASLFALIPTSLLVLQSIDQLSLKDILLMFIFALLVSFYISRLQLKT